MLHTELKQKQAGYYSLISVELLKLDRPETILDISELILGWSINESMNNSYLQGNCSIVDGIGLYYNFLLGKEENELNLGLRGEEEIIFKYKDYFGKELTHRFFVYRISNFTREETQFKDLLSYTLNFVSKEKFYTDRVQIRRSYKNKLISDYVRSIFDEYYVNAEYGVESTYDKPLDSNSIRIENTKGKQDIIIPNYRPDRALHLLSRRAISSASSNKMQTFRFFQNRSRYMFKSHDSLNIELDQEFVGNTRNKFIQIDNPSQGQIGQEFLMQGIKSISFPDTINTIRDMVEGNYYRSTTEIDWLNRTILTTPFKYLDEYVDYYLPDTYETSGGPGGGVQRNNNRSKHTKKFVDKHFNNFQDTLVIRDYPYIGEEGKNNHIRENPYYDQMYNPKSVNLFHHKNEMVEMEVWGRNSLTAGDTVEIEMVKSLPNPEGLQDKELDEERNGFYLIEEISNIFTIDSYTQKIKMSKSGIRGAPESVKNYNNKPQTMSVFLESTLGTLENRQLREKN